MFMIVEDRILGMGDRSIAISQHLANALISTNLYYRAVSMLEENDSTLLLISVRQGRS